MHAPAFRGLGQQDLNLRVPESKSGALPLGYAPKKDKGKAREGNSLAVPAPIYFPRPSPAKYLRRE